MSESGEFTMRPERITDLRHRRHHGHDPFAPPKGIVRVELEEGYMAGWKGPTCPFCGSRETFAETVRDWSGVLSEDWGCANCDESGWVVDGRLLYVPEGEHP